MRATEGNPDKFEEDVGTKKYLKRGGTAHKDDSIDSGNRVFYDKESLKIPKG